MLHRPGIIAALPIGLLLSAAAVAQSPVQSRVQQTGSVPPAWAIATRNPAGVFVGSARSPSESQARQAALGAAIDKSLFHLGELLFANPSTSTFYGIDALRQYLQKVSSTTNTWAGGAGGEYEAYAQVQINTDFLKPLTVQKYATSPPVPPYTAVGYLLVPGAGGTMATTRRTQVRMAKLRDGNFYFYFNIVQRKERVTVQLDHIQVLDDGSAGKTHWSFDIGVAGRSILQLPAGEYTDTVGTYRPQHKPYEQPLRADALLEIKVTGNRGGAGPIGRKAKS